MSDLTPISSRLELSLDNELRRMNNEWFFKWHFIGGNETVELDGFDGRTIRYAGVKYFGSAEIVFWDAISRYLRQKIEEIFSQLEVEIRNYPISTRAKTFHQVEPIIAKFAGEIRRTAVAKDQVLRGNGFEKPSARDQGKWTNTNAGSIRSRIVSLKDIYCNHHQPTMERQMGFQATVLKIMIASPGDVVPERVTIREVIHEWNAIHADKRRIVLLPVGWETHSYPEMGQRAQAIINKQILAGADILVAAFWTKLGTPTGSSASGTAEEISEHIAAGKPALLYFSAAPVKLDEVDPAQFKALTDFKKDVMQRGLIEQYESLADFKDKISRHLAALIYKVAPEDDASDDSYARGTLLAPPPSLTAAAAALLQEASKDEQGVVMALEYIGGSNVTTNNKNFIENGDSREVARWRGAVKELERLGYIEDRGGKGEVFFMTNSGYEAADALRAIADK